jgi:DNA polymerase III delta subunit
VNYGYNRFLKDIESLSRKRSFAIVGEEAFFKREALLALLSELKKHHDPDIEWFEGSDKKLRVGRIDEALCEYPLIGKFRLIVVIDADKVKDINKLDYWFKDPTLDTRAIFMFSDEVDKSPFEAEVCCVANDLNPGSKEFDKYVDYCLDGTGKVLTDAGREHVKHTFANNAHLLKNELLKAAAYVGTESKIDVVDLQKTLASFPIAKVFDLVDLIIRRDQHGALVLIEDLLEQGVDGTHLIHLITLRLQVIAGALKAQRRGENLKDYMIRKKIPLFQFEKVLEGLKLVKDFHLSRYYDLLCNYDYRLRLNRGEQNYQRLIVESMVIEICR